MITRSEHNSAVNVDKSLIFNKKLSAEARLLLIMILSYDDDHKFKVEELVKESGLTKYKIDKALKELKENKYLQYKHISVAGRYDGVEWIIRENPYGRTRTKAPDVISEEFISTEQFNFDQPQVISTSEYNFNRIWEAYPTQKRCDRKAAMQAFNQIPNANDIIEDILDGLHEMKGKENWLKEGGKWIPGLPKFLENHIWEEGLKNPSSFEARNRMIREVLENARL